MTFCKDCKHYDPVSRHRCTCPKMFYGYGREEGDDAPDALVVEDDEGWGMIPGPEFGCVHGEAASNQTKSEHRLPQVNEEWMYLGEPVKVVHIEGRMGFPCDNYCKAGIVSRSGEQITVPVDELSPKP
jgi:hypothetical protein